MSSIPSSATTQPVPPALSNLPTPLTPPVNPMAAELPVAPRNPTQGGGGGGGGGIDASAAPESNAVDPALVQYQRMLKLGVPKQAVVNQMRADGKTEEEITTIRNSGGGGGGGGLKKASARKVSTASISTATSKKWPKVVTPFDVSSSNSTVPVPAKSVQVELGPLGMEARLQRLQAAGFRISEDGRSGGLTSRSDGLTGSDLIINAPQRHWQMPFFCCLDESCGCADIEGSSFGSRSRAQHAFCLLSLPVCWSCCVSCVNQPMFKDRGLCVCGAALCCAPLTPCLVWYEYRRWMAMDGCTDCSEEGCVMDHVLPCVCFPCALERQKSQQQRNSQIFSRLRSNLEYRGSRHIEDSRDNWVGGPVSQDMQR